MNNKYDLTREQNIKFAKKLLVDSVYKSANLEGIKISFQDTKNILNDVNVPNIKPSEISKVCALRDGWHFILDNLDKTIDLAFLENLHELIAKADLDYQDLGVIRKDNVRIGGTNWIPELPDIEKLHNQLTDILKIENITERAISVMLWIMRSQVFIDGNKRIATLVANKILIENGGGILSIPVELDRTFKVMLVEYYESNNMEIIKQFIYENCIEGTN